MVLQEGGASNARVKALPGKHCGVSLRLLRAFAAAYASGDQVGITTTQVVQGVVKTLTARTQLRLVDVLADSCSGPDDVGVPEYFVSHAWFRCACIRMGPCMLCACVLCYVRHANGSTGMHDAWCNVHSHAAMLCCAGPSTSLYRK